MKIYIRMAMDRDPRPGDADPYHLSGTAIVPCCERASNLWYGKYDFKIRVGLCGGGPTLSAPGSRWALQYSYCIFCGTKVEQLGCEQMPEGLKLEPA